jgi:hypothetical protein
MLSADEKTNKARLAQTLVEAKIEGYKQKRQQLKTSLANSKAGVDSNFI